MLGTEATVVSKTHYYLLYQGRQKLIKGSQEKGQEGKRSYSQPSGSVDAKASVSPNVKGEDRERKGSPVRGGSRQEPSTLEEVRESSGLCSLESWRKGGISDEMKLKRK